MMTVEPLTIRRTWHSQDGNVLAEALTKVGDRTTLTVPREMPPGRRILAERTRNGYRFIEAGP